ncbi:unnamed protein product, partial [Phaeothamnion confervicola]
LTCALCGRGHYAGEPLPGPLVGQNPLVYRRSGQQAAEERLWVHDNCVFYSPQTSQDTTTGSWRDITKEIRRGRQIKCSGCNQPGATIGCFNQKCRKSYHFPCARDTGWNFEANDFEGFRCQQH